MAEKTPFDKYKDSITNNNVTEDDILELIEYIELLESQLEEADELIEEYAAECGDSDFDDDEETQLEDEKIVALGEMVVRKVKFNRSKRRTRRKYYRRNRAKIKIRQKKYRRSASFRKSERKRSKTSYRHKKYI